MRGILTTQQQLSVLSKIWGNDREGYVFLPWIPGWTKDKAQRRKNYHEGPAFEWPADKDRIIAHLSEHTADDVYFAPCLFVDQKRVEQAADIERALWADLDEVHPEGIDHTLRPTIAWESSPGRFQGVWLLDRPWEGASWPGRVNHQLTAHLGADPSGWDTTQLLRVPGRPNFKWEYKAANDGNPVQGQLLWDTGPRYTRDQFDELPIVEVVDVGGDGDLMDAQVIDAIDRHDVWARVRLKLSGRVREFMAFRNASQVTEDMDRSEIQWQIMRELADAGCTVAEIVAVIRPTVWNSYAGRRDELKRLKIGALKAVQKGTAGADDDDGGALEEIGDDKPPLRWLTDVMEVRLRRPRWLVRNVWSQGGCGFIAGDPKSYKSWMGIDLAVSVATGIPFLNDPSFAVMDARPALYLQEEDSEIVVRDRLDNIVEGKCPHLHWNGRISRDADGAVWWSPADGNIPLGFHVRTGFIASDPGWQMWLADAVMEGKFSLVVIDTLGTTAGEVDTDRAPELMGKILRPLREISHQTGTSISVIHHNRKSSNGDMRGGQRMLGSVSLHAWVDDAIYVHSRENMPGGRTKVRVERESKASTEHRWIVEVPRMGVWPDGTRTVWEPATGLWDASEGGVTGDHDIPSTPPKGVHKRGAPAGSRIAVRIAAAGGKLRPIPIERIMEMTGLNRTTVVKQITSAKENGLVTGDESTGYTVTDDRARV